MPAPHPPPMSCPASTAAAIPPAPVWPPLSPPLTDALFDDHPFEPASPRPHAAFPLAAPSLPPHLSLAAPASSSPSELHSIPTPPSSNTPNVPPSVKCELLSPPAAPPPPLLPLPLPQLPIITLSEDTRACRYRRLLRIQHRRRVRRNAPPSRSTRNTPVRDEAALNRRAARVIRNREVALRARQKQKELMKTLESENCSLKNRATSLELENSTLKMRIDMLRRGAFLDLDVSLSTAP